jgi:membrane protease YdiL (CAAX protease family)
MLFHGRKFSWLDAETDDVSAFSALRLRRLAARRGLIVYFTCLIIFSTLAYWFSAVTTNFFGVFFLMWSPGVASLLTRLILHEGWSDISFRLVPHPGAGSVKSYWLQRSDSNSNASSLQPLASTMPAAKGAHGRMIWLALSLAALVPLVVALLAYGFAWMTGLAYLVSFHPSTNLNAGIVFFGGRLSWWMIALLLVAFLVSELVSAAGEEIGWRGYMLTRLIDAGVPQPVLVSGLIWSFWHWPLLFLEAGHLSLSILLSACIFVVTITCLGFVSARLRLQTGSIWPSIVLHATWNIFILELFDAITGNSDTSYWIGESGILVALLMVVMAYIFWHNYRIVRSTVAD